MNTLMENKTLNTQNRLNAPDVTNELIRKVCRRIPPLWPLKNFVAVNPFVGLSDEHFLDAAKQMRKVRHGDMLMPAEFFVEAIDAGHVLEQDFAAAVELAEKTLPSRWAEKIDLSSLGALRKALCTSQPAEWPSSVLAFADFLDQKRATDWAAFTIDEISKWCSTYYDQGQSSWQMPWRDESLFAAWKAAAQLDANPELKGLRGFRKLVSELPDNPVDTISKALDRMGVTPSRREDFLHRQLMSVAGWASHVQFLVRENGMAGNEDDSLVHLLAIRLAYDLALFERFAGNVNLHRAWVWQIAMPPDHPLDIPLDLLTRYLAQLALESHYQRELVGKLTESPVSSQPADPSRPALQAVFCIDVRSEVFRRALESQSDEIETIGFAGFFGMPIEFLEFGQSGGNAQCPVLLSPGFRVREALDADQPEAESELLQALTLRRTASGAWNAFRTSAISCFSFVETAGLGYGVRLVKDALGLGAAETSDRTTAGRRFRPEINPEACCQEGHGHATETGIQPKDQIELAAGALRNMGLTTNFARTVLICGHGSTTANNPYGSALDCGACGGHAGDANARVAAAILNQPAVRAGLKERGIHVPEDTVFVAGLHNTTTDEVTLYDTDAHPELSDDIAQLETWLAGAGAQARRERASGLGLEPLADDGLDVAVMDRSRDWSQVRPEWGLAGNAAFIAAPRERTRGMDLGGRTFLHNYHASRDTERSVLELIMVAPMVVASWINLQYYGSTVNNRLFGSGNKVIHNVVGTFGVYQGNGGDLQAGLPLQSLHDGQRWMHEPLRLNVFLEAPREAIEEVIQAQADVRQLVDHGWINLFAIEPSGTDCWRYLGELEWQKAN